MNRLRRICEEETNLTGRDIARLEECRDLSCADRYIPLIYPQGASLLDYLGPRLLAVSEGAAVKESLLHSQFLEDEDIKTLLEQGGLTRMAGRFSKGYGELSALYEKGPTLLLDSFPRSYPGLRLGELSDLQANTLSVWGGQLDPLLEDLRHYLEEGYCIYVWGGTRRAEEYGEEMSGSILAETWELSCPPGGGGPHHRSPKAQHPRPVPGGAGGLLPR